jgi:hypothetical protein
MRGGTIILITRTKTRLELGQENEALEKKSYLDGEINFRVQGMKSICT